jgi:hypothetical protein
MGAVLTSLWVLTAWGRERNSWWISCVALHSYPCRSSGTVPYMDSSSEPVVMLICLRVPWKLNLGIRSSLLAKGRPLKVRSAKRNQDELWSGKDERRRAQSLCSKAVLGNECQAWEICGSDSQWRLKRRDTAEHQPPSAASHWLETAGVLSQGWLRQM